MRKLLFTLLLPIIFATAMPAIAQAETTREREICQYVQDKEGIVSAQCVVYQNNCVVAIKTEKFVTKSYYDKFRGDLQWELVEKFHLDNIVVTRNPKAMHIIEKLSQLPEKERNEKIADFIEREMTRKPANPNIQPR